jgi:hypothetical protein
VEGTRIKSDAMLTGVLFEVVQAPRNFTVVEPEAGIVVLKEL